MINTGGDTAFRVAVPDSIPRSHTHRWISGGAATVDSVILGMGERVDAIVTVGETSVPVVAVPERRTASPCYMRVHNKPATVDVPKFVANVRERVVLDTAALRPAPGVKLLAKTPQQVLDLRLSGPVNGYTWPSTADSTIRPTIRCKPPRDSG